MKEILEEARRLLGLLKKPVHYEFLYELIREEKRIKLKPVGSKPPSYELYAAFYFELKEEDCPFVLVSRGVYALKEYADGDYDRPERKAKGEGVSYRPQRREAAKLREGEAAVCGNCTHLNMTESDLIQRDGGTCDKYEESGRGAVACCRPACPHWEIRSSEQRFKDKTERTRIRGLMVVANAGLVNFRGRDKK